MTKKEKENWVLDLVNIVKEENEKNRDCLTTSQLGRPLGLTAREVYEKLCSLGVLYYSHHRYMLTKAYCYRGLMMYRNFVYFSKEGERKLRRYPVWTPSGVESLRKLIAKEMK